MSPFIRPGSIGIPINATKIITESQNRLNSKLAEQLKDATARNAGEVSSHLPTPNSSVPTQPFYKPISILKKSTDKPKISPNNATKKQVHFPDKPEELEKDFSGKATPYTKEDFHPKPSPEALHSAREAIHDVTVAMKAAGNLP